MKKIELKDEIQFEKLMNQIIIPGSVIGTHCILSVHGEDIGKFDLPKEERANLIIKKGLFKSPYSGYKGIISTVYFHGEDCNETYNKIWDYSYNYEYETYKVIIALPHTLNLDNQEYIIGDFPIPGNPYHLKSLEYEQLASKIKFNSITYIPKEFIVGYVVDETENRELLKVGENIYNKHTFYLNEKYYSISGEFSEESKEIVKKFAVTPKEQEALLRGQKRLLKKIHE